MPTTSVDLPAGLVEAAMHALGTTTKRSTIVSALEEVVRRHQQDRALDTLVAALAVEHDAIVLHYDRDFEPIARAVPTLRHEWVAAAGALP